MLTGFPNYPEGRLYPGYRQRLLQRGDDGRDPPSSAFPCTPSHTTPRPSGGRRNYASFAVSAALIGIFAVKACGRDCMCTTPPATVALPAIAIGWIRRIPFVYDIQDLWPDTLGATGMMDNGFILKMMGSVVPGGTYRAAARVVVLSPGFKSKLVERGVPPEKIDVIYNWCDESPIVKGTRDEALAGELGLAGAVQRRFLRGRWGKCNPSAPCSRRRKRLP